MKMKLNTTKNPFEHKGKNLSAEEKQSMNELANTIIKYGKKNNIKYHKLSMLVLKGVIKVFYEKPALIEYLEDESDAFQELKQQAALSFDEKMAELNIQKFDEAYFLDTRNAKL